MRLRKTRRQRERERGWEKKGRNRAPSCQREANLIAKRRRKKHLSLECIKRQRLSLLLIKIQT